VAYATIVSDYESDTRVNGSPLPAARQLPSTWDNGRAAAPRKPRNHSLRKQAPTAAPPSQDPNAPPRATRTSPPEALFAEHEDPPHAPRRGLAPEDHGATRPLRPSARRPRAHEPSPPRRSLAWLPLLTLCSPASRFKLRRTRALSASRALGTRLDGSHQPKASSAGHSSQPDRGAGFLKGFLAALSIQSRPAAAPCCEVDDALLVYWVISRSEEWEGCRGRIWESP
jgi:hypothetical protein